MDISGELNRIVSGAQQEANAALSTDDFAEAKRVLSGAVRDLRDLKRQLVDDETSTRLAFQDAKLKNRETGQTVGLFVGSKTRGAMARGRAIAGRSLAAQQADALRPFAHAKSEVDRAIAALDRAKLGMTNKAADAKATGRAPATPTELPHPAAAAAPPPPPAWQPDPTGRHEHRYWDGSRWSEHVADAGVSAIDPY